VIKVPGELTAIGSFFGREAEFGIWLAKNGFDGTVLKPNLAIITCQPGQEENVANILEANKPGFISYLEHTKLSWANP
jgi:hypothetical protein